VGNSKESRNRAVYRRKRLSYETLYSNYEKSNKKV
jgi:hypothetical protein